MSAPSGEKVRAKVTEQAAELLMMLTDASDRSAACEVQFNRREERKNQMRKEE